MSDQRIDGTGGSTTHDLLRAPSVEAFVLTDDGVFPNNRKLPLLVYRKALNPGTSGLTGEVRALFVENHWGGSWTDGIYDFHHYHSTAHEVLAICGGQAEVRFGGEHGITLALAAGDAVVIPAGVAHKSLGASSDFVVVGAYPRGQENHDMCYGKRGERPETDKNVVERPCARIRPPLRPRRPPHGPLATLTTDQRRPTPWNRAISPATGYFLLTEDRRASTLSSASSKEQTLKSSLSME